MSRVWRQTRGLYDGGNSSYLHPMNSRLPDGTTPPPPPSGQSRRMKVTRPAAGYVGNSSNDPYTDHHNVYYTYGNQEFEGSPRSYGRDKDFYPVVGHRLDERPANYRHRGKVKPEVKHRQGNGDNEKSKVEEFCNETGFDGFKHVGNRNYSTIKR